MATFPNQPDPYEDITKPTADFFTKLFPARGLVKIGTETKSGFWTVKTTSQRTVVKDEQSYDTTLEPKYEDKESGITAELKLQTQSVFQLTLSKSNLGVNGLKLSGGVLQNLHKQTKATQFAVNVGGEYAYDRLYFKVNGGYPFEERPIPITGSIVLKALENLYIGAKYDVKYSPAALGGITKEVELKGAATFGQTNGFITGTLDRKFGVRVHHKLSDELALGVMVQGQVPQDEGATKIEVDIAAQKKLCASAHVQGKLNLVPTDSNTGVRFGLGMVIALPNTNATANLGADFNVAKLADLSAHSLGFELKLK